MLRHSPGGLCLWRLAHTPPEGDAHRAGGARRLTAGRRRLRGLALTTCRQGRCGRHGWARWAGGALAGGRRCGRQGARAAELVVQHRDHGGMRKTYIRKTVLPIWCIVAVSPAGAASPVPAVPAPVAAAARRSCICAFSASSAARPPPAPAPTPTPPARRARPPSNGPARDLGPGEPRRDAAPGAAAAR